MKMGPSTFRSALIGLTALSIRIGDPPGDPPHLSALDHELDAFGVTLQRIFIAVERLGGGKSLEP